MLRERVQGFTGFCSRLLGKLDYYSWTGGNGDTVCALDFFLRWRISSFPVFVACFRLSRHQLFVALVTKSCVAGRQDTTWMNGGGVIEVQNRCQTRKNRDVQILVVVMEGVHEWTRKLRHRLSSARYMGGTFRYVWGQHCLCSTLARCK